MATSAIPSGMEITVDAYSGRVYQGNVPELSSFQKTIGIPYEGNSGLSIPTPGSRPDSAFDFNGPEGRQLRS